MSENQNTDKKACVEKKIYQEPIFILILFGGLTIITLVAIIYGILISKNIWDNDADSWIALIIGGIGAIATAELGYVAVWQNKKATYISEKMMEMEEKEKHSLLFIRLEFSYHRDKLRGNIIDNSQNRSVNYFIAKIDDSPKDYIEKLIFKCVVENKDLESLNVTSIKHIGDKGNIIDFDIVKGLDTCINYDVDAKNYIVEIDFITDRKIADLIISNDGYFEIVFEFKNIHGVNDKRKIEINFYNSFKDKEKINIMKEKEEWKFDAKAESITYRRI